MLGLNSLNFYDKKENGEYIYKIPQMRVSAMDCFITQMNFIVTLNEFTFGFKSVSGIEVNKPFDYYDEGGVNDHQIAVGRPENSSKELTFTRGLLIRSPAFIDNVARAAAAAIPNNVARKAALIAASSLSPREALEDGPALGIIQVFGRNRRLHSLYSFMSLGMTKWSGGDLDATTNDVLIESITIAHTGITRHPVTLEPGIIQAVSNAVSDYNSLHPSNLKHNKLEDAKNLKKASENFKKKQKEKNDLLLKQKQQSNSINDDKKTLSELENELKTILRR